MSLKSQSELLFCFEIACWCNLGTFNNCRQRLIAFSSSLSVFSLDYLHELHASAFMNDVGRNCLSWPSYGRWGWMSVMSVDWFFWRQLWFCKKKLLIFLKNYFPQIFKKKSLQLVTKPSTFTVTSDHPKVKRVQLQVSSVESLKVIKSQASRSIIPLTM